METDCDDCSGALSALQKCQALDEEQKQERPHFQELRVEMIDERLHSELPKSFVIIACRPIMLTGSKSTKGADERYRPGRFEKRWHDPTTELLL